MTKTQHQRVRDAEAELARWDEAMYAGAEPISMRTLAHQVLCAADREAPTWPSDQFVDTVRDVFCEVEWDDRQRTELRAALLDDPIIQAAIALRDQRRGYPDPSWVQSVTDAVNEAGL